MGEIMKAPPSPPSASRYMVVLMGVATMDYMATFFSLPILWGLLGGSIKTYGLVLGLYPLARALFSPIFGLFSDKMGTKAAVVLCCLLMVSGNVLFCISTKYVNIHGEDYDSEGMVEGSPVGMAFLIGARLLAGMGTACLSLVTSYLLQAATTDSQKVTAVNKTKIGAMLGATVGNIVTLASLMWIPPDAKVDGIMTNGITIPVFFCILSEFTLLVLAYFFVAPVKKSENPVGLFDDEESKRILKQTIFLNLLSMLSSLSFFLYFSQLVPIATSYYHLVENYSQMYKVFIPTLIGSIAAMIITKKLIKRGVRQITFMKLGVCSSFVGGVFLFGWGGGMDLLFYIGGAFFFMGNGMFMTGVRGTLSRVIEKSRYVSTLMGWMFISAGIGIFLGSALGSLFLDTTTTKLGRVELTGVDGLIGFLEGTLCILFIGVQLYDSAQEKFGWVQEEKIPRFEEEEEEPLLRKVNN